MSDFFEIVLIGVAFIPVGLILLFLFLGIHECIKNPEAIKEAFPKKTRNEGNCLANESREFGEWTAGIDNPMLDTKYGDRGL
ncbi:hypothetical protein A3752_13700 [Oleiphilus sp. HI0081]|uniref:hypothetical protein n=1 Tax=unclassified Oleiphilus TaxID=2631174 RepID=UPI0007C288BE|nr:MULTISPECIES: hypothetical protein [unclassified Oleiphilus]KZY85750.1 hypothetical protein A3743_18545 [Oleiphilus sp. HI0072]KZZ17174.1 hypothetical protein A3749_22855 [Oleiphilus sp. HI0078]KZZ19709.1 hypothetical protein A3752_13700 [Oleiphilus sp. HI0081]KZY30257.1 hypothetical protein A3729_10775 [Oleiphilus sp. HI0043]KZZ21460.1 hypothetical protein A3749_17650 [Oleiphilus sp. HI0078]